MCNPIIVRYIVNYYMATFIIVEGSDIQVLTGYSQLNSVYNNNIYLESNFQCV